MSDPVSALNGRAVAGDVVVRDTGLRGMIALRGDLASKKLRQVCKSLTGLSFPDQRKVQFKDDMALAWMSPDEVLIMLPYADVPAALGQIAKALKGRHHLAVDVSDARAVMQVKGPFAREVLAKLAPVDLHPASLQPGDFRRTRLGQVAAAFWMSDDTSFSVICFRSVADYAFDLLAASAKGGPVGHM